MNTEKEIIANKELILDRANPRAFIFSHSALKEGWDNPNVFVICALKHSDNTISRRGCRNSGSEMRDLRAASPVGFSTRCTVDG